jgi:hypothetical protein
MLISRNGCVYMVIRLSASQFQDSHLKQRGLRGNVIAFPQDISKVNECLNLHLPQLNEKDSIQVLVEKGYVQ